MAGQPQPLSVDEHEPCKQEENASSAQAYCGVEFSDDHDDRIAANCIADSTKRLPPTLHSQMAMSADRLAPTIGQPAIGSLAPKPAFLLRPRSGQSNDAWTCRKRINKMADRSLQGGSKLPHMPQLELPVRVDPRPIRSRADRVQWSRLLRCPVTFSLKPVREQSSGPLDVCAACAGFVVVSSFACIIGVRGDKDVA